MNIINVFIGAITGSVGHLITPSGLYKEVTQDIYNLDIPTTASDRKALYSDRSQSATDLKKSFEKHQEKWRNNKEDNK